MKIKVYSIWSEDQGSWWPRYVVTSRREAEEEIVRHCEALGVEDWINTSLIYIDEGEIEFNLGTDVIESTDDMISLQIYISKSDVKGLNDKNS